MPSSSNPARTAQAGSPARFCGVVSAITTWRNGPALRGDRPRRRLAAADAAHDRREQHVGVWNSRVNDARTRSRTAVAATYASNRSPPPPRGGPGRLCRTRAPAGPQLRCPMGAQPLRLLECAKTADLRRLRQSALDATRAHADQCLLGAASAAAGPGASGGTRSAQTPTRTPCSPRRAAAGDGRQRLEQQAASSGERASAPTWSSDGASGNTPEVGTRPYEGLCPQTPQ